MKYVPEIILILILIPFFAAAKDKAPEVNPFDISSSVEKIEELGIPTISQVDALEETVTDIFNKGDCSKAVPMLNAFAKKSNWLANLMSSGLDPFYNASYDKRNNYRYIGNLVRYESLSNEYKRKRNIAIAMQGECLAKSGDTRRAVPYLVKALGLIDIDNEIWWTRTRDNLYAIIGVK